MIGVMALIILGPERLPKVARTAGMWIGKARSMMREVKADIKSELDATEMDELKSIGKDLKEAGTAFKSQVESVDKNVNTEASEMDKAIGDALNKPVGGTPDKTTDKPVDTSKSGKQDAAKKTDTQKKSASPKTRQKKSTGKKTAKKKPSKKKVTKKKTEKASSEEAKKA
jgi:sec-independent protein translocase protein TatB